MISRPLIIATGSLMLIASLAQADKYEQHKRALANQTSERMKTARLQELSFVDASVREVIDALVDMSTEIDGAGFNVLYMDGSKKKSAKKPVKTQQAASDFGNWDKDLDELFGVKRVENEIDEVLFDPEKKITLRLRRVSMWEALKHITSMSGLTFRIDGNVIVIKKKGDQEDVVTKFYPIDPNLFQERIRHIRNNQRERKSQFDFDF